MSSGLLQVFDVELENLHGTSNNFIYYQGDACSDSVSHNWVQVRSMPVSLLACSQDWTCNLQMIVAFGNQRLYPLRYVSCSSQLLELINWMFLLD